MVKHCKIGMTLVSQSVGRSLAPLWHTCCLPLFSPGLLCIFSCLNPKVWDSLGANITLSVGNLFWLPVRVEVQIQTLLKLLCKIAFRLCLWWLQDINEFMFSFGPIPKISHYVNANIPKSEANVKSKTFLSPGISEGCSASNSLLRGTIALLLLASCPQWGGCSHETTNGLRSPCVLGKASSAMERHHDLGNSYKESI